MNLKADLTPEHVVLRFNSSDKNNLLMSTAVSQGRLNTNDKGEIVENIIAENDLCLFNDKQPIYLHSPTRNYFALNLSICSQIFT